jgi:hypothetical protein
MSKEKFLDAFHKLDPAVRPELRKYIGELEYLYDLAFRNGQREMQRAAACQAMNTINALEV